MLQIDDALLERTGLGDLPAGAKEAYKKTLYERLEMAVGTSLARRMSEDQLDEFERLQDGPEPYQLAWLHINFPTYKQVVKEELQRLSDELAREADEILSLELAYARS